MSTIRLDWDASDFFGDPGHYNIFRSTTSGTSRSDYTDVADVSAGTTTYDDSGLDDGEQYFYRVDAVNGAGSSNLSNETSLTTTLPAPSNLAATAASDTQIDLAWTDNATDEHGYRVYRGTSSGSLSQIADLAANTTSYSDTGLTHSTTYYYEVRSYTDHTTSSSTEVSETTNQIVTETGVFTTASASPTATETASTTVGASKTKAVASPFSTETASTTVGASLTSVSASPTGVSEQAVANEQDLFTTAEATAFSTETGVATETDVFTEASASPFSSETIFTDRVATMTGSGTIISESELTEVFPSQSSTDLNFNLITDPVLGFASEWVYEDSQFDDPTAFSVVLDIRSAGPFEIRVQYRESDSGPADYTTPPETVDRDNQIHTWDELGEDGDYRLIVSEMRPRNYLRAITWGPTRL